MNAATKQFTDGMGRIITSSMKAVRDWAAKEIAKEAEKMAALEARIAALEQRSQQSGADGG